MVLQINNSVFSNMSTAKVIFTVLVSLKIVICGPLAFTPGGTILGSTLESRLGRTIYSFRGIRYGKAPVGELRFQAPQPAEPWQGVYNATADGPRCPQPGNDPISEDCLFLNVHSPQLPSKSSMKKLPVIILLHPGGFSAGSGRSQVYGPQYLLDQDVVLVTLNYRLATLGFLSLGKESPGNYGLKDQNLAMKWVQKNIQAFGGDPNSVTLYGYSAGSMSVALHMVSPMSKGLFHKAICSSWSSLGQYRYPKTQLELARKQANMVGCNNATTNQEIYECFKNVSAEKFASSLEYVEGSSVLDGFQILLFSPVVEDDFGQERFLTDQPIKLVQSGNFMNIPMMSGLTKDEFADIGLFIARDPKWIAELDRNFNEFAPPLFMYESGTLKSQEVTPKIREYYFGDAPLNNASESGLEKLVYDSLEGFAMARHAILLANKSSEPVYFYKFNFQGRYSHIYLPGTNDTVPYGVSHHDDLLYLFRISRFPFFNVTDPEARMVDKMTTLWANFARTGNPTPDVTEKLDNIRWVPYNAKTDQVMSIDTKMAFIDRPYKERYTFWDNLFPISHYL